MPSRAKFKVPVHLSFELGGVDSATCTELDAGEVYMQLQPNKFSSLDLPEDWSIWWEPIDGDGNTLWSTDLDVMGKFDVDLEEMANSVEEFRILTREIGPVEDGASPLVGDDIAMLEQLLWKLGSSPSKHMKAGISATRLVVANRRKYLGGDNSVGRMVGRLNYFSHKPSTSISQYEKFVSLSENGKKYETVNELKDRWYHYASAFANFNNQRYSFSDLTVAEKNAAVAVFDGIVNYPRGPSYSEPEPSYLPTYTAEIHDTISQYGPFERIALM